MAVRNANESQAGRQRDRPAACPSLRLSQCDLSQPLAAAAAAVAPHVVGALHRKLQASYRLAAALRLSMLQRTAAIAAAAAAAAATYATRRH